MGFKLALWTGPRTQPWDEDGISGGIALPGTIGLQRGARWESFLWHGVESMAVVELRIFCATAADCSSVKLRLGFIRGSITIKCTSSKVFDGVTRFGESGPKFEARSRTLPC
jgi:hypothetical protein